MFFIAAALVLTTAGVFAGKAKFTIDGIYAYDGTHTATQLSTSIGSNLTTTAGGLNLYATTRDRNGNAYGLYAFNTTTSQYVYLYSTSAW